MNYLEPIKELFKDFSNRETALIIWLAPVIIFLLSNKGIRKSVIGLVSHVLKSFTFHLTFISIYIFIIVFGLWKVKLWDESLLKDTVFWFLWVALPLFFKVGKADTTRYFRLQLNRTFKWTILLEFVVNLNSFSLVHEVIAMPILFLCIILSSLVKKAKGASQARKLINGFCLLGVGIYSILSIYITLKQYRSLFTEHNLETLLLPAIMTTCFLPVIYGMALYMRYQTIDVRLNFGIKNPKIKARIKKEIRKFVGLNLNRLNAVEKKLTIAYLMRLENIIEYKYGKLFK